MANRPPFRPWFRLASLRPVSAPPAPAQEPRPSLVQPTTRTNSSPPPTPAAPADRGSVPSFPAQKLPALTSSSLPTSPVQKASLTTFSSVPSSSPTQKAAQPPSASSPAKGETTARGSRPSTKPVVQTSMQSPKSKPTTPPPSPLTLPPSQLKANSEIEPKISVEAESKKVIAQKTIEKAKQWLNGNSGETGETQKIHNERQKGNQRKLSDSEDSEMKFITIAGENRGAYMELIQSPKKHEFGDKPNYLYKKGNSKTKTENGQSGNSSSDEGNVNKKENKSNRGGTKSSNPTAAFMNSNVQCVNNSLLYNASCTHHDPGIRLSLSKKPHESEVFHLKRAVNGKHD